MYLSNSDTLNTESLQISNKSKHLNKQIYLNYYKESLYIPTADPHFMPGPTVHVTWNNLGMVIGE